MRQISTPCLTYYLNLLILGVLSQGFNGLRRVGKILCSCQDFHEIWVFSILPNIFFFILVPYSFPFNMLLLKNLTKMSIQPNLKFSDPLHPTGCFILVYVDLVLTNTFDTDTESPQFFDYALNQGFKTQILSFSVTSLSSTARSSHSSFLPIILSSSYSFYINSYMFSQSLIFTSHFILKDNLINSFTCSAINHLNPHFCTNYILSMPFNLFNNTFTDFYFLRTC